MIDLARYRLAGLLMEAQPAAPQFHFPKWRERSSPATSVEGRMNVSKTAPWPQVRIFIFILFYFHYQPTMPKNVFRRSNVNGHALARGRTMPEFVLDPLEDIEADGANGTVAHGLGQL